jgi:hypothetical protein
MMFDSVFYDYGGASSNSSCRVSSAVECVIWNPQIAVLCKVCFRKKHNVNVATGKKVASREHVALIHLHSLRQVGGKA